MTTTKRRKLNIGRIVATVCVAAMLLSTLSGCASGAFGTNVSAAGSTEESSATGASSAAEEASSTSTESAESATVDPSTLDPTAQELYAQLQSAAASLNGRLTRESIKVSFKSMTLAPERDEYGELKLDRDGHIKWYKIGRERRLATKVAGNTKPIDDALTFPFENVEELYDVYLGKAKWTDELAETTRELVDKEMLENPVYLYQVFVFADKFFLDEEGNISVADVYQPATEFIELFEKAWNIEIQGSSGIELWCYLGTDGDNYLTDGNQERPAEFADYDDYIYYAEAAIAMLDCFEFSGVVKKYSPAEWHMRNANATENRMAYAIWADYAENLPSVLIQYFDKSGKARVEVGINLCDMRWEKFKDFHQTAKEPDPPKPVDEDTQPDPPGPQPGGGTPDTPDNPPGNPPDKPTPDPDPGPKKDEGKGPEHNPGTNTDEEAGPVAPGGEVGDYNPTKPTVPDNPAPTTQPDGTPSKPSPDAPNSGTPANPPAESGTVNTDSNPQPNTPEFVPRSENDNPTPAQQGGGGSTPPPAVDGVQNGNNGSMDESQLPEGF